MGCLIFETITLKIKDVVIKFLRIKNILITAYLKYPYLDFGLNIDIYAFSFVWSVLCFM